MAPFYISLKITKLLYKIFFDRSFGFFFLRNINASFKMDYPVYWFCTYAYTRDIKWHTGYWMLFFDIVCTKDFDRKISVIFCAVEKIAQYEMLRRHRCRVYISIVSIIPVILYQREWVIAERYYRTMKNPYFAIL